MTIEDKIVEYLKQKANLVGIILHGSRARGTNADDSDWDIYILVESGVESPKHIIEKFEGEQLDADIVVLPVPTEKIKERFGTTLRDANVLYEEGAMATELISRAQEIYAKPCIVPEKGLAIRKLYLERTVARLERLQDKPELFFWRLGDVYGRLVQYWFEILHQEHGYYPADALKRIKEKDENYYRALSSIAGVGTTKEKTEAVKVAVRTLFP